RHERRDEERRERNEVHGFARPDLAVRRLKVKIDQQEAEARERNAHDASAGGARAQHDQQIDEDDVDLIDPVPHLHHHHRHQPHRPVPQHPAEPLPPASHGQRVTSARYPTPGSVMMSCGAAGSTSIFRRKFVMCTRRYCCGLPNCRPHTASKICWCVSVRPAEPSSVAKICHSMGVRCSCVPSSETFRAIVSITSPPTTTGPGLLVAAAIVLARRICAFARAASSRTLNGLVT